MKNERDPWARVKDESELRVGMAVQVRPCVWCGKTETVLLLKWRMTDRPAMDADGNVISLGKHRSWSFTKSSCCSCDGHFLLSIREGRLYRIADDQLADDAEPATAPKSRSLETAGQR